MKKIFMLMCLFCLSGCYVIDDGFYYDTPYYGGRSYSAPRPHHNFQQPRHHSVPLKHHTSAHHSHNAPQPSHGLH